MNIHIVDVVYWSIIFLPSPYKYSSEYSPENKSFLTIDSSVFWCTTVFNTDTILSFITSKTVVSTLSKSCGVPLSIIQYPIYTLSIYSGKKIADFALPNSICWYGNLSLSLFTVTYLGVACATLSLNISTSWSDFNDFQCFWFTFDALISYSAPLKTTIVEYLISYFSINISFILFILSSTFDVSPIVLIKSCTTDKFVIFWLMFLYVCIFFNNTISWIL